MKPPIRRNRLLNAFSLVEVAMAMSITSFSLLSVIALLPSGLQAVKDSAQDTALSSIIRSVRAELNQTAFTDVRDKLTQQSWHFDYTGLRLDGTSNQQDRYFEVTFDAKAPTLPAGLDVSTVAQTVTIRATYPVGAPSTSQTKKSIVLLASRQSGR
jgi:uncharacterized protein (TIGR02598 family)